MACNMLRDLFSGRLNRRNYIMGFILYIIMSYLLLALNPKMVSSLPGYFQIYLVLAFFFAASLIKRRLNDIGLPKYSFIIVFLIFIAAYFLPDNSFRSIFSIIGSITNIILVFYPSQKSKNIYGDPPAAKFEIGSVLGRI